MSLKGRVLLSNFALSQRILVPLNVISVIALSALGVVFMHSSSVSVRETMDSKIEFAVNFLQRSGVTYLANYDLTALDSFVRETEKDPDVASAVFMDPQQKPLTNGSKASTADDKGLIVVKRELKDSDGKLLGYIRLAYFTKRVDAAVRNTLMIVVIAIFSVQAVLTMALLAVSRSVSHSIRLIVERLTEASGTISNSSSEMSVSSENLSRGVAKQAAAVQETVASMAEMSSMLAQTAASARGCHALTGKVAEKTKTGSRTMEQMVSAMGSIESANAQLYNMVNIIKEISSKTQVINEIVFKTQLLSLNASIEAARAGQHGRGFAVVAEEVGNLAQMSGSAAKEISSLLESSMREVQAIVKSTEERVKEGRGVSDSALRAFNEIANDIATISTQIQNINEAAKEQEQGVKQSSSAMVQVDETTHANSNVAKQVYSSSLLLGEQSKQIMHITRSIRQLIFGAGSDRVKMRSEGGNGPGSAPIAHIGGDGRGPSGKSGPSFPDGASSPGQGSASAPASPASEPAPAAAASGTIAMVDRLAKRAGEITLQAVSEDPGVDASDESFQWKTP